MPSWKIERKKRERERDKVKGNIKQENEGAMLLPERKLESVWCVCVWERERERGARKWDEMRWVLVLP